MITYSDSDSMTAIYEKIRRKRLTPHNYLHFIKQFVETGDVVDIEKDVAVDWDWKIYYDPILHYLHRVMSDPLVQSIVLSSKLAGQIFYESTGRFVAECLHAEEFANQRSMGERVQAGKMTEWSMQRKMDGWQSLLSEIDKKHSDDGFDLINNLAPVEIDHCWAFYNGYRPTTDSRNTTTFQSAGDGNGFKAGGYGMNAGTTKCPAVCPQNYIHHCVAFRNKSHGLYSNHHLGGCRWEYNSSWYNRSNYNMVNRKSNEENVDVPGYSHILRNNVSFTFTDASKGGHLINCDAVQCILENNTFAPAESAVSVTADMFVSTDASTLFAERDAEGNLPEMNFMRAKAGSVLAERNLGWATASSETSIPIVNNQPNQSDALICNLAGMRVSANGLTKGIYIKQGKKFVVR